MIRTVSTCSIRRRIHLPRLFVYHWELRVGSLRLTAVQMCCSRKANTKGQADSKARLYASTNSLELPHRVLFKIARVLRKLVFNGDSVRHSSE